MKEAVLIQVANMQLTKEHADQISEGMKQNLLHIFGKEYSVIVTNFKFNVLTPGETKGLVKALRLDARLNQLDEKIKNLEIRVSSLEKKNE